MHAHMHLRRRAPTLYAYKRAYTHMHTPIHAHMHMRRRAPPLAASTTIAHGPSRFVNRSPGLRFVKPRPGARGQGPSPPPTTRRPPAVRLATGGQAAGVQVAGVQAAGVRLATGRGSPSLRLQPLAAAPPPPTPSSCQCLRTALAPLLPAPLLPTRLLLTPLMHAPLWLYHSFARWRHCARPTDDSVHPRTALLLARSDECVEVKVANGLTCKSK